MEKMRRECERNGGSEQMGWMREEKRERARQNTTKKLKAQKVRNMIFITFINY